MNCEYFSEFFTDPGTIEENRIFATDDKILTKLNSRYNTQR